METLMESEPQQEVQRPLPNLSKKITVHQDRVSNSASSFVVVGIQLKVDDVSSLKQLMQNCYANGFCVLNAHEDGVTSGYCVVGKDLVDGFGELEFRNIPLEKILQIVDEVKSVVNLSGEVGLFTGTRNS